MHQAWKKFIQIEQDHAVLQAKNNIWEPLGK